MVNLSQKSVVLTGAGSGIGRATAVGFARKGARLTLVGRRQEPLEETARLVSETGGEAQIISGDVSDPEIRQRAVKEAVGRFGGLDVLVNNAGAVRAGRLENLDAEEIQAQIEVNLTSPILMTRIALPALRDKGDATGDATIVNVSSRFGLVGMPFYSAYAATKAGIAHFGEALRRELYGEGVHVLTVYPGATETPMMESNEAGPELGFQYESAEALVAGVESGELEIVRGARDRSEITEMSRERPRELDEQVAHMKDELEAAVANHRSM